MRPGAHSVQHLLLTLANQMPLWEVPKQLLSSPAVPGTGFQKHVRVGAFEDSCSVQRLLNRQVNMEKPSIVGSWKIINSEQQQTSRTSY